MKTNIKASREFKNKNINIDEVKKQTLIFELYSTKEDTSSWENSMLMINYLNKKQAFNDKSEGDGYSCMVRGADAEMLFDVAKIVADTEYKSQMEEQDGK